MWKILRSPRSFLWFITGAFCFSPEEEPLPLVRMQTQCCWCGILVRVWALGLIFKIFSGQNLVWDFSSAICFPGEIWSRFPPSMLPVKIPIREGRKFSFILGVNLGPAASYSQWWASAASLSCLNIPDWACGRNSAWGFSALVASVRRTINTD